MPKNIVSSLEELATLYDATNPLSLEKETCFLTTEYKSWISQSRFFALATHGTDGLDCSPRGDRPEQAFKILDEKTLLIPDRRGNNRLDSLKNIIENPQVALMFLIPGINEALRIIGEAVIATDHDLINLFTADGTPPKSVIYVNIKAVYFQCARSLIRSDLWNTDNQLNREQVPTAGKMMKSAKASFDADAYDQTLPERQNSTLY